jgi:subtilisin family serine protease
MERYKVIVPRLNVRKAPVADFNDKSNIITTVSDGLTLDLTEVFDVLNPSLGKWYTDGKGQFYSELGLMLLGEDLKINKLLSQEYPWWIKQLGIDHIWNNYNEKGNLAKVAVIDTGYNINNPEINNGVVGTYLHPSFLGKTTINDNDGHGTYCASVIGARNKINIISCAPESQLYISKMANRNAFKENNLSDAIDDAIRNKVDIISISNTGDEFEFDKVETAINKAVKKNIIVIAAIGNNESEIPKNGGGYPALYNACLAVGSSDKNNKISLVTLINSKTEINAPGEDIYGYILNNNPEKYPTSTSIATAIVAGICALIISYHKKKGEAYTVSSIKRLISDFYEPTIDNPQQKIISPTKIFNQIK